MRLFIAGWQGQLAQSLVKIASSRTDVTACAIGRPALDICEIGSIERALINIQPNVIINTAGYTDIDRAEAEPARAFALNRDGARMLAAVAARRGIPIIHISTDYVFDGSKQGAWVETDEANPNTVYGRSKLEGEIAVRDVNPRHIILRMAWVFSPFGRNFVKTVVQRAQRGEPLRIVADQRGSPTYAPHLAAAVLDIAGRVAGQMEARWGTYHAAGSGEASWYDIAVEVLQHLGAAHQPVLPIAAAEYPTHTPRPANAVLDCTKLRDTFEIQLPHWRDGVRACIDRLGGSAAKATAPASGDATRS